MLDGNGIQAVFEQQFRRSHRVELCGGGDEPLYLPAENPQEYHQLIYRLDYPASALHEIAHWCLASDRQLLLKDWGLWYQPDGRTAAQQQRFQKAEARVQALEWILSLAAGRPFRESSDNLSGEYLDDSVFKRTICSQARRYVEEGLPARAAQLAEAFARARGVSFTLSSSLFSLEALGEVEAGHVREQG